jgi:hydroxymethylglutaryl-CoA reductase
MQKRGGILDIVLNDKTNLLPIITTTFETKDSININSCLEQFAKTLKEESQTYGLFSESEKTLR